MFENCNQRFPPLAKQVAPVSLYQNIVPTKCLRNQLGMVRSITIGRCNWYSLTSASPPLTKIIDRRKTFIDLASLRLFMANNFVHRGGRGCETRYFFNKITKKCMRICLTVLKIVLQLLKGKFNLWSTNLVLKMHVYFCL